MEKRDALRRWLTGHYLAAYVGGAVVMGAIREGNWWVAGGGVLVAALGAAEIQSRILRRADTPDPSTDQHRAFGA